MTRIVVVVALTGVLAAVLATPGGATHTLTGVNVQDQIFVKAAGQAGAAEIRAAHVALAKSSNAATLAFARRMIKDHTALATKLKQVASENGLSATNTPSSAQSAQINALARLSGASFDHAYSKAQVAAHVTAITLFTTETTKGGSPSLRAAAAAALPTLRMHLTMAHNLETAITTGR